MTGPATGPGEVDRRPAPLGGAAICGRVPGEPARPADAAVLTVLGTVVGVAALVATLGLSKTAGNQIIGRFDELAATRRRRHSEVRSGQA